MNEETALVPVNLFGAHTALQVIEAAKDMASPLAALVKDRGLLSTISGKEYVKVEGWTLLGSMLGVFPIVEWTRPVEDGWEARVEARTRAGEIVGAAEAECLRSERNWSTRDDFALRSMAQTRATSKALRLPLGFVMALAGFEATPAEEMVADEAEPAGPPCPHCGAPVQFNDESTRGKRPVWSCQNRACGGGGPRDKNDPGKGNWPWGSYDADFFVEGGADIAVARFTPAPQLPVNVWTDPVQDYVDTVAAGADDQLRQLALDPMFTAGTVRDIRDHVDHAITMTIAMGKAGDGILDDLWQEWRGEDPARKGLFYTSARAGEIHSFAKAVQGWLRGLAGV